MAIAMILLPIDLPQLEITVIKSEAEFISPVQLL